MENQVAERYKQKYIYNNYTIRNQMEIVTKTVS